jgi:soluble lytic murein transglycosylase-like protein
LNQTRTNGVRRTRTPVRNDTRSLLRSRPLQAALAVVAGIQVLAVASGGGLHNREPHTLAQLAAVKLAPSVSAPVQDAVAMVEHQPITPDMVAPESTSVEAKPAAKAVADSLAGLYRAHGFEVSPELAAKIHQAAVKNDIDPKVAFGLVRTESEFRNSATSPVGAIGLTQLMPATAKWFQKGVTRSDLRNPDVNLNIGFRYLRELIDHYDGNTRLALTAYNRGPGIVDRVLKRGGNPENGYARKVLSGPNRR